MDYETKKSKLRTGMDLKDFSLHKRFADDVAYINEKYETSPKNQRNVYDMLFEFMLENSVCANKFLFTTDLVRHLFIVADNSIFASKQEINRMIGEFEDFKSKNNLNYGEIDIDTSFNLYQFNYNSSTKEYKIDFEKVKVTENQINQIVSRSIQGVENFLEDLIYRKCNCNLLYLTPTTLKFLEWFIALFDEANDYVRFVEFADMDLLMSLFFNNSIENVYNYLFANDLVDSWFDLSKALAIEKKYNFCREDAFRHFEELRLAVDYYIAKHVKENEEGKETDESNEDDEDLLID